MEYHAASYTLPSAPQNLDVIYEQPQSKFIKNWGDIKKFLGDYKWQIRKFYKTNFLMDGINFRCLCLKSR